MKASLERPSCSGKCREYGADHSDVTRRVGRVEIRYWPGPTLVARWLAAVAMIGISARPRPISNQHVKPVVRLAIPLILSAFSLGACVQTPRDPLADANLQPRDRALLATHLMRMSLWRVRISGPWSNFIAKKLRTRS